MTEREHGQNGWDAITAAMETIHGAQQPIHVAGIPPLALGGDFQGISAYQSQAGHWHAVTYAFTELWERESESETSGLGFELTLRVPARSDDPSDWMVSILAFVCRYVWTSGNSFEDGHWMALPVWLSEKGWARPWPGVAFVLDPELGSIDTPNGRVDLLQLVGLRQESVDELMAAMEVGDPTIRDRVRRLAHRDHPDDPLYLSPPVLPMDDASAVG